MSKLQHRSGGGKRDAEKYFIQCKDPASTDSWLTEPDALDVNQVRALVTTVITDGILRKNKKEGCR